MQYNVFRECLQEHEVSITGFPGNRSPLQLKRLRESIEVPEKHIIVIGNYQREDVHFPSVTHIVIVGDGTRGELWRVHWASCSLRAHGRKTNCYNQFYSPFLENANTAVISRRCSAI
jgi:hypothetical protein